MPLTTNEMAVVSLVLHKFAFYDFLRPEEKTRLLAGFEKKHIGKGETIIRQGEPGHIFYILAAGTVEVYVRRRLKSEKVATLGPNSFFGEMALIGDAKRTATVVCQMPGVALTLLRDTFQNAIMANPHASLIIERIAEGRKSENLVAEYEALRKIEAEEKKDRRR